MVGNSRAEPIRSRWEQIAHRCAAGIFVVISLAYLGLIGIGQWQADEYADFARSTHPFTAFVDRLSWSPRPLSESVFALYGRLTLELKLPLTTVFLAVLWMVFLMAGLARFRRDAGNSDRQREFQDVALTGMALIAAFLTANRLTEVFYWPAGAVAYLPSLSVSLFVFLYVAQGALDSSKGRFRCAVALVCAALCSETGAFFAVSYAIVTIVAALMGRGAKRGHAAEVRSVAWLLWPGICGALVLLTLRLNRYRMSEPVPPELAATVGHPAASLVAAISHLAVTVLGPGQKQHGWIVFNVGFLSILLLVAGIALLWTHTEPLSANSRRALVRLASAFLFAAVLTLFATCIHHGSTVGERHEVMVRCWVRLAAASAAIVALSFPRFQNLRRLRSLQACAPVFLILGVVILWHVAPLIREYRAYGAVYRTIRRNFVSGFASGTETMEWVLPPNRGVITPATIELGTYSRDSLSDYPRYILAYFDKRTIVVREYRK